MSDKYSIESFNNNFLSYQKYYYIIFYIIPVPTDMPRLVSKIIFFLIFLKTIYISCYSI